MTEMRIITRIRFADTNGSDIAYLYSLDSLKELGLEKDSEFYDHVFINIDTIVNLNDKMYKVEGISTCFRDDLVPISNSPGVNLYSKDELTDYNFEITYFIKKV